MPVLSDPQKEAFARELAEQYLKVPPPKRPEYEAYTRAGYRPHHGNPGRMARKPDVAARVQELLSEYREYADIRPAKALVRVDRIADATLPEFYEEIEDFAPDGSGRLIKVARLKDPTKLPRRLAEAISEIEYHEDGSVKRIKLHDKMSANTLILRHFGGLPPEQAQTTQVNVLNVLSAEDQRHLAEALEDLSGGETRAGEGAAPPGGGDGEAP